MKHLLLLTSVIFISLFSFSQKNSSPGYIIKSNGDSVHGFLQDEVRQDIVKQIKFAADKNATTSFTPAELKSFGYDEGSVYKSISFKSNMKEVIEEKKYFAKYLVHGEFDLYSYMENETTYFVVFGNDTSYLLYNRTYTGMGIISDEGNFYQSVIRLGANCEKMSPAELDRVIYTEKAVSKFVSDLNQCVAPDKTTATFYHKSKTKANIFAFAGGLPAGKNSQLTIEGGVKLSSPQISKRAYLNIGIHYSHTSKTEQVYSPGNIKYDQKTTDEFFSIPVTLQFNFTSGIIQPFINFGISAARHSQVITPKLAYTAVPSNTSQWGLAGVGAIGIEGHITKSIFINAEWRLEELLQIAAIFQYPAIGIACRF